MQSETTEIETPGPVQVSAAPGSTALPDARMERAALAFAAGHRNVAVAEAIRVCDATVSAWRNNPSVRARVAWLQEQVASELVQRQAATLVEVRHELLSGALTAARTLAEVAAGDAPLDGVAPQTRIQAATALLDRVGVTSAKAAPVAVAVASAQAQMQVVAPEDDDLAALRRAVGIVSRSG